MTKRIRRHLTYANVLSTLCLFALLGGGAYAALKLPKNSVGSKQIKDGQVRSVDVGDGTLSGEDLAAGLLPKEATPAQLRSKLLGVDGAGSGIDADMLDGQSSGSFAKGQATIYSATKVFTDQDSEVLVLEVPGLLRLEALVCSPGGGLGVAEGSMTFRNLSGAESYLTPMSKDAPGVSVSESGPLAEVRILTQRDDEIRGESHHFVVGAGSGAKVASIEVSRRFLGQSGCRYSALVSVATAP